ncbi:MAG: hypothetical protein JNM56_32265 [Planctomycetia bacterium]|nr:hypothetical protein [Planctomycetia bacterium]
MKVLGIVPLAGLLLSFNLAGAADDKLKESTYFPLKVGTKWHYRVGPAKLTLQVAKHEKVGDVLCALIETLKDGNIVATEHVAVRDDGVFRYTIAGQKPEMPFQVLKLPPKKGDTWKVAVKIGNEELKGEFVSGEEEVEVPAGKYQAVTATSKGFQAPDGEGNMQDLSFKFWYAPKVGQVKQTIKIGKRPEIAIELERYESP